MWQLKTTNWEDSDEVAVVVINNSDKKIMTYRLKKFTNNDTTQIKIFTCYFS